jgi:hypothetical protein
MNAFRHTRTGALDREYLRTCAVYRLLRQGRIGAARAVDLLTCPVRIRRAVVEIWKAGPLKEMLP